ncbi:MAG: hypothetical protein V4509_02645 [Patescibacteria group bacterium]
MIFLSKQKKLLLLVSILSFSLLLPSITFAANGPDEDTSEAPKNLDVKPAGLAAQDANITATPTSSGSTSATAGLYSAVGGTATCSAGQILGRLIGSAVGQAVSGLTNNLKSSVTNAVKSITKVPVIDQSNLRENEAQSQNTQQLVAKSVGGGDAGASGILSGITNSIKAVSWDSIMYCIVNEIMTYITQSTIQWINTGFNGNPVFVQNIGAMFQQIGDREASNFMREISAASKNSQGLAINGVRNTAFQVAEPFRQSAINTILYAGVDNTQATPAINPTLQKNWNAFMAGQSNVPGGGIGGFMQAAQSNVYIADMNTLDTFNKRVQLAQSVQQSQIQNGIQSYYKCKDGKIQANGYCSPIDRIVTAPAQGINNELASVQGMKYLRLSFAKDFDSVVSALVNQLVKVAINKVFESAKK